MLFRHILTYLNLKDSAPEIEPRYCFTQKTVQNVADLSLAFNT